MKRLPCRLLIPGALLFLSFAFSSAAATNTDSGSSLALKKNGIAPDAEGILAYLFKARPTPEALKHIDDLVRQLGADSFSDRQAAQKELSALGLLAEQPVRTAAQSSDPEISERARKMVARFATFDQASILFAALQTLSKAPPGTITNPAAADVILDILPLCGKPYLQQAAGQALAALAGPANRQLLLGAVATGQKQVRRLAAMPALGKVLGAQGAAELYPFLEDAVEKVRLAAARALAESGDRKSLLALVDLLSSGDRKVRKESVRILFALTGKNFGYAAYAAQEKRDKAVADWRTWLADNGQTARLSFPLKDAWGASYLNGHTLFAYGYGNKVEEEDADGKVVWSYVANGAWSAEKMANGNVLIAAYSENKVLEVNPGGDVVWQSDHINCMNAKPLANGNVLVADYAGNRAVEIQKDGNKVVWEHALGGNCADIQQLDNGNTLVAGRNLVREISPEGMIVWEWSEGVGIYGVQRLENGNTLVTDHDQNRVYELNPAKEAVWEFAEDKPGDAFRLPDGNTLITNGGRFIEVTPDKKILRTKAGCNYGTARR